MSDSGPHDRFEWERQEAHDEASASVQGSDSGHVEVFSHAAQDEARDPERPSPSPQLSTHETPFDSEKSSPDTQPPSRDEAQDSAEKPSLGPQPPTHEEAHDFSERPSSSPVHKEAHGSGKSSPSLQPPPTHEQEQHASVKEPPISKRKARAIRAQQREERERKEQERRKLENERRLNAQREVYERWIEARRKAEEAAAVTRAQGEGDERSTNEGEVPQRLSGGEEAPRVRQRTQQQGSLVEESVTAVCREDAEGGLGRPTVAIKMDDDQKAHNDDDAEPVGAPRPRVLKHDTGVTCLAITDNEHSESRLIMMAHSSSTSTLSSTPALSPITPRDPSDSAFSHSGLGYYHSVEDDVTRRCQCGLVLEDLREASQTRMESKYLFDPPFVRLPSPKPVEIQTRQDATDVLFQSSVEGSGDSAAAAVTVIIPRVKTGYYIRNNGVSTTRDLTHDFEGGRRAAGRGGYRGYRSRGRGRRSRSQE